MCEREDGSVRGEGSGDGWRIGMVVREKEGGRRRQKRGRKERRRGRGRKKWSHGGWKVNSGWSYRVETESKQWSETEWLETRVAGRSDGSVRRSDGGGPRMARRRGCLVQAMVVSERDGEWEKVEHNP